MVSSKLSFTFAATMFLAGAGALFAPTAYAQSGAAAPDFDGDGKADLSFYRPSTGTWHVLLSSTGATVVRQWGLSTDLPVPGDYDGDGRTDFAVYRRPGTFFSGAPSDATWYVLLSGSNYTTSTVTAFGQNRDIPMPADYDGDGKSDRAVYRPGSFDAGWYLLRSRDRFQQTGPSGSPLSIYPVPGDFNGDGVTEPAVITRNGPRPVNADYDGDGITDRALYSAATGVWTVTESNSQNVVTYSVGTGADTPVPADYDGDGRADPAVFRPTTGEWIVRTSSSGYSVLQTTVWGQALDIPLPNASVTNAARSIDSLAQGSLGRDFDGDHRPDITIFRPSTGDWYSLLSSSGFTRYIVTPSAGIAADLPFPTAFNDGRARVGLYRPSDHTWQNILYLGGPWGLDGDIPAPADYSGLGQFDITVYRPANHAWYTSPDDVCAQDDLFPRCRIVWGGTDAIPVPGAYFSPDKAKAAFYTRATGVWNIQTSFQNVTTPRGTSIQWGLPDDNPVPADFDGDGRTDIAQYNPSTGAWRILYSSTEFTTSSAHSWGLSGDIPVPADYDGDGRADIAVFRPGNGVWYILKSSSNYTEAVAYQWGLSGDIPIGRFQ